MCIKGRDKVSSDGWEIRREGVWKEEGCVINDGGEDDVWIAGFKVAEDI